MVAHRRAGKTVATINDVIRRAAMIRTPNARFGYVAPFREQGKTAAWEYLKRYSLPLIKHPDDIRESELSVRLTRVNNSVIRIFGADNPNALRGGYFDGIVLDEYADMKPSVWTAVIRPALADRGGWGVFIGTPRGRNAFYEVWDEAGSEPTKWFRAMIRASESGILPADELRDMRRTMSEDEYEQEAECSFDAAIRGAVYGRQMKRLEDLGRMTGECVPADHGSIHTSWDLGLSDSTAIWWFQALPGEVRILDYYEANGELLPHYVKILNERAKANGYKYGNHYVPHDALNKLLAAGGRSIVQQLDALGVTTYPIPATSQQNSIEAARKTLERCWFHPAKCKQGIEALKQYQFEFDEQKKTFNDKPRHDWASHAADAFEQLARVWAEPKNAAADKAKPRFLHEMTADEVFFPAKQNNARILRI